LHFFKIKTEIQMSVKWEGVMPAVTTKFDSNDNLDLDLFAKNIHAQIDAGVTGIILGGTHPFGFRKKPIGKAYCIIGKWEYSCNYEYCRANHQRSHTCS
jgi:hypothetical protein